MAYDWSSFDQSHKKPKTIAEILFISCDDELGYYKALLPSATLRFLIGSGGTTDEIAKNKIVTRGMENREFPVSFPGIANLSA